jgi:hypothetical protein
MPLAFPSNPTLNQEYTFSGKTWVFNGTGWKLKSSTLTYQPLLVSGVNIKTVGGQSLLGVGDVPTGSSPLTTKGDLYSYSTVNGRFGVGANTALLEADSAQTFGLKWTVPSTVGRNFLTLTNPSAVTYLRVNADNSISALNAASFISAIGAQTTLVSGTSIKTINSTTLLGAGDLVVQPTLVSGTNIKSLNGATLLGSGNLTTVTTLDELTDVVLTTPTVNQILYYTGTQWINASMKTVNLNSLYGSGDIAVQSVLISGNNIKTINGNSLVGSGDLTVAAAPAGNNRELQYNNSGVTAGAANVEIIDQELSLAAVSIPATPPAGFVKLFGRNIAGKIFPASIDPSGLDTSLQSSFALTNVSFVRPNGNSTTLSQIGLALSATGTATAANIATTNLHTSMRRLEYLVTTAATTAVAGWRGNASQFWRGNAAGLGGFLFICRWGPATGVSTTTNRAFCGLRSSTSAPTDAEPSPSTSQIGMAWDAADSNIQLMHNDSAGNSTKIDLGATHFAVPTSDRTAVYEIALFCPPNASFVNYLVTNLVTGGEASGQLTTDLPSNTTFLNPYAYMSVGGTSSVIGIALMSLYIETDY